ncbi:NUMOD4 domain-containing protein [Periweissella fabalis]|uniref:NUMOD4 domain-containing protein n=1 Tax=Periweissella fabalis TaxID=1070421 RepID=A0A7X6S2W3_9LACO|nr:NUMOD4 domain-containing protein [Periweissella fabalis]MCM0599653.1 hypothetical protein [Periweissella fabalis]NKZ23958.1 hypothetical protein [Periweissella fabalis]
MENLRAIPGFEGHYGMNSTGEVYRLSTVDQRGHKRNERSLKASVHGRGYLYVRLSLHGERKMYSLNTLIRKTYPEVTNLLSIVS